MQIVSAVGPSFIDDLFDSIDISKPTPPEINGARISGRLYRLALADTVVVAAQETWDRVREFFTLVARDGWERTKVQLSELIESIREQSKILGKQAAEYEQLLLEKLHEMVRKTSELLLKSVSSQVQVGQLMFMLNAINVETKLLFSASIEASLTALGKFLGSGEVTVKATYSLVPAPGALG